MSDDYDPVTSLRAPRETVEVLDEYAEDHDMSRSQAFRYFAETGLFQEGYLRGKDMDPEHWQKLTDETRVHVQENGHERPKASASTNGDYDLVFSINERVRLAGGAIITLLLLFLGLNELASFIKFSQGPFAGASGPIEIVAISVIGVLVIGLVIVLIHLLHSITKHHFRNREDTT